MAEGLRYKWEEKLRGFSDEARAKEGETEGVSSGGKRRNRARVKRGDGELGEKGEVLSKKEKDRAKKARKKNGEGQQRTENKRGEK